MGRELRELFASVLAPIGPRNIASLLIRGAVMITMMTQDDDSRVRAVIADLTDAYIREMPPKEICVHRGELSTRNARLNRNRLPHCCIFTTPHIVEFQRVNLFLGGGPKAGHEYANASAKPGLHRLRHTRVLKNGLPQLAFFAVPSADHGGDWRRIPRTIIEITRKFVARCAVPTSGPTSAHRIPTGSCSAPSGWEHVDADRC